MSTQYEKSQSRSIFGCEFIFYAVTQVKNNKLQGINEWIKNKSFPLGNSFDLNFHMRFVRRLQVFQVFFPYFPVTVPPTGLACLLQRFFSPQFVLCCPTIFDTLSCLRGYTFLNRKMKKKKGCFGLRMDNLSPPSTDWTQRAHYPRLTDCFSLCTCHPAFVYHVRYRVIFCARVRAHVECDRCVSWKFSSGAVSECLWGWGGGGCWVEVGVTALSNTVTH